LKVAAATRAVHTCVMQRPPPHALRARYITALAVALIAAACSAAPAASDPATASPEPSASPALVSFASERFGYSIRHPGDWDVLERPGEFELTALRPRHPGTDTLGTPDSHKFDILDGIVVVGARELAEGETLDDFTTEASAATRCGPHGRGTTTLDGEPADLRKFECGGTRWVQVTAEHDGRGYLVWVTRPLKEDFLTGFAFTD
jgi:hypothetical protein